MNHEEIASEIAGAAHQLWQEHPHKDMYEHPFTMYSYNRFTRLILQGIALQMLEQGSTEEHIRDVLASKHIRWMLDKEEMFLVRIGRNLAKENELARLEVGE